jgi:hypothetical protein
MEVPVREQAIKGEVGLNSAAGGLGSLGRNSLSAPDIAKWLGEFLGRVETQAETAG